MVTETRHPVPATADDDPAKLRRIAANLATAKRRLGNLPKPMTLF
jgi:hypothetical protein